MGVGVNVDVGWEDTDVGTPNVKGNGEVEMGKSVIDATSAPANTTTVHEGG